MLTGELRSQVDQIWNAYWSGGVSNPLSVIEQIILLFIKRLDDLHTLEEKKAATLNIAMERRIFPDGNDETGRPYTDLRWSRFKNFEPRAMMETVADRVFPFLRTLGEQGSSYGQHMKDARLGFSNTALLNGCTNIVPGIIISQPNDSLSANVSATGQVNCNGETMAPSM